MARKVLIIGQTGTGKTWSAGTLDPASTIIICPDEKELPFRGWKQNWTLVKAGATGEEIGKTLDKGASIIYTTNWKEINGIMIGCAKRAHIKTVILDTITFAQIQSFMDKATVTGYGKFTEMAAEVYNLMKKLDKLRDDLNVIIMAHSDTEDQYGIVKTKFAVPGGKLIGEKIKVEGMFTVVLETDVQFKDDGTTYHFITQNTGQNTAKSPAGMFEGLRIDNDLKAVLESIEAYENGVFNS
jgi:hypothetical protein